MCRFLPWEGVKRRWEGQPWGAHTGCADRLQARKWSRRDGPGGCRSRGASGIVTRGVGEGNSPKADVDGCLNVPGVVAPTHLPPNAEWDGDFARRWASGRKNSG